MVRLLDEQSNTKSNVKLGGFWSQLQASYISSHTEELWYNKTVCLWMTIYIYIYTERERKREKVYIYIYIHAHSIYIYVPVCTTILLRILSFSFSSSPFPTLFPPRNHIIINVLDETGYAETPTSLPFSLFLSCPLTKIISSFMRSKISNETWYIWL